FAQINQVSAELVDLEYEGIEQLGRYKLVLLPVPSAPEHKPYLELSAHAREVVAAYVRDQGGTVVAYPAAPREEGLRDLFATSPGRKVGNGQAVVLDSQFDRWVPLSSARGPLDAPAAAQNPAPGGREKQTGQILDGLLASAGITRAASSRD